LKITSLFKVFLALDKTNFHIRIWNYRRRKINRLQAFPPEESTIAKISKRQWFEKIDKWCASRRSRRTAF